MKPLYDKEFSYTEEAIALSEKISAFFESLDLKDYNPIELESILHNEISNVCINNFMSVTMKLRGIE